VVIAGVTTPISRLLEEHMKMSSEMKTWKYARLFLDTSALIKLLAPELKEPGTKELKNYLEIGMRFHTSNYCIGEALGVLKRRWISKREKPNLSTDGYLIVINRLSWKLHHNKLVLHELSLSDEFGDIGQMVKKYNIDYIDALLLNHTLHSEEHDLFVTADQTLSKAARDSGAVYWNIVESPEPPA